MSRPSDSQRSRLYRAEEQAEAETFAAGLWAPLDGSLAEAQRYADRVVRSRWWKANASANQLSAGRSLTVIAGDRGHGGGWAMGRTIKLGAKPRVQHQGPHAGLVCPSPLASPPIILHELAHVGTLSTNAAHGPEFARLNLGLVRRFLGPEVAAAYRSAFRERNVRHRAVALSSARPRGNPEALAAFVPTSDGEWVVAAELLPPEPRDGQPVGRYWLQLSIGSGNEPRTFWAKNYETARGLRTVTTRRAEARVWKNEATARRWAERFAAEEGPCVGGWRVEAR